ncbi:MAG: flagellar FliJ family protein [Verrucomicrobia bacterium]|nr:flagellar FliJ family protein [Verrucomicrobiota bacterium]
MKKFNFKLDSVFTVRRYHKNQAAYALAAAQKQRLLLMEQLNQAAQSRTEIEDDLLSCYQTPSLAAEIIRRQDALTYQRHQVEDIEKKLQEALNHEDKCREIVLLARQGEETILKLLEKEKERYRHEQDREDELAVVEFINARHHLSNVS